MCKRDQNNILVGDLDYGHGKQPVQILSQITPFLFYCTQCELVTFHVVGQQRTGMGIGLPFSRKMLWGTGKACYVICNKCTGVQGQLPQNAVAKLETGVIPAEICKLYLGFPAEWRPYTRDFNESFLSGCPDQDREWFEWCLNAYRLETAV